MLISTLLSSGGKILAIQKVGNQVELYALLLDYHGRLVFDVGFINTSYPYVLYQEEKKAFALVLAGNFIVAIQMEAEDDGISACAVKYPINALPDIYKKLIA